MDEIRWWYRRRNTKAEAKAKLEKDGVTLIYKRIFGEEIRIRGKTKTKSRIEINKEPPKEDTSQNSKEIQSQRILTPKKSPIKTESTATQKKTSKVKEKSEKREPTQREKELQDEIFEEKKKMLGSP